MPVDFYLAKLKSRICVFWIQKVYIPYTYTSVQGDNMTEYGIKQEALMGFAWLCGDCSTKLTDTSRKRLENSIEQHMKRHKSGDE